MALGQKWRLAVVGCGSISVGDYLPELKTFPNAEVVAVCDVDGQRARETAEHFQIPYSYADVDQLLAECEFDILLDLAAIPSHFDVNLKAVKAGKHLYTQKPITTKTEEAAVLIAEARRRGLKIAASPIHMLRPEIQEAARLIREGVIGKVSLVRCSASHGGPEYFQYRQADPTWFYLPGGGPVLDMGVHGLHQVTGLMGPAERVSCLSGISETTRIVRTGAFDGKEIHPVVDDNTIMNLDFGQGTFAIIDCTYCIKAARSPAMEIYGSKGTITFVRDRSKRLELFLDQRETGVRGWMDLSRSWPEGRQSMGVRDLIAAIEEDREPVLRAEHAMHVVEIMEKAEISAREGRVVSLETRF